MPARISKVDVWAGEIADRAGGLAEKLEALATAGASLEFVVARRAPDRPGTGVVFLAPVKGARQTKAAVAAGLSKASSMHSLRLEAPDRPGLGARITRAVAEAGVSMRGLSAAALGRQCVVYFAFDSEEDARKAAKAIKKALGGK
ncbi:MAG TPA: ACT domain-containing protein [Phycisphaerae bacterium]|nr:ACT domain-containing protein [Phycisphaerae bacterium]